MTSRNTELKRILRANREWQRQHDRERAKQPVPLAEGLGIVAATWIFLIALLALLGLIGRAWS